MQKFSPGEDLFTLFLNLDILSFLFDLLFVPHDILALHDLIKGRFTSPEVLIIIKMFY